MSFQTLREHPVFACAAFALLGSAVALRSVDLGRLPGVNGDEAYYGAVVLAHRAGENPPWRSGSGLPLNPFYAGLLYLIHVILPQPSLALLRLPALLSGLACLALSYPLLARVVDRLTALLVTLLLACAPILIGYSRFGWDQSQAPLAALLCLYFALRRQWVGATAAFGFALVVHPVNGLLLPIMLGPAALAQWDAIQAAAPEERQRLRRRALRVAGILLLLGVGAAGLLASGVALGGWVQALPEAIAARLLDPLGWGLFLLRWGDLLTGVTISTYVAGPLPEWLVWLQRGLYWLGVVILLRRGLPRLRQMPDRTTLGLLAGLVVSMIAFYLLLGVHMIGPDLERYAMYLVVSSWLVLALLARSASKGLPHPEAALRAGGIVAGALLLAAFVASYWLPLVETGGAAHRTFRTGPVEPKAAAFAIIQQAASPGSGDPGLTILAEDWWCYYPLRYLSYRRPATEVIQLDRRDITIEAADPRRRFVVGFAGGPVEQWLTAHAPALTATTVLDSAGRPVLRVWDLGTDPARVPALAAAARTAPP